MAYTSLVRSVNPDRQHYNTSLSTALVNQIKELAKQEDSSYNFLIEEGLHEILDNYNKKKRMTFPKRAKDRKQVNTTYSAILMGRIDLIAQKWNVKRNDIIEEAMRRVVQKRSTQED